MEDSYIEIILESGETIKLSPNDALEVKKTLDNLEKFHSKQQQFEFNMIKQKPKLFELDY